MARRISKKAKSNQDISPVEEAKERKQALDQAISQIEKQFGKGSILMMGDNAHIDIDVVPTGALTLDLALGIGGLPKGRIIEIYGPESSGKTTVALHTIAEVQKEGGYAAFIDAEHALDPSYAQKIGVNVDELLLSQPDNGEQALEICEALARSGAVDVIVVDSVAALVPKAEIDGDMGDSHMGLQARLMSQALRKLAGVTSKSNTLIIFINQIREKIGVMFGNNETTTGGRALKFYSSVRLEVRRMEGIKQGDKFIGNRTRVKVLKNKLAPPFKEAVFDIIFGEGISQVGMILDMATDLDLVNKSGSWYSYGDEKIGQGRDNACQWLKDHPDVMEEIDEKVRETLMPDEEAEEAEETEDLAKDKDDVMKEEASEDKAKEGKKTPASRAKSKKEPEDPATSGEDKETDKTVSSLSDEIDELLNLDV